MIRGRGYGRTARSGTWISLGEKNMVRFVEIGSQYWNIDISDSLVSYPGYGGMLAIYRRNQPRGEREVILLTTLGRKPQSVSSIRLPAGRDCLFLCWNEATDHLLVLLDDCSVHFFDCRGTVVCEPISLNVLPQVCLTSGTGLVGISRSSSEKPAVVLLVDYSEREGYVNKSMRLPSVFQAISLRTLLVVRREHSDSGVPEVFLPFVGARFLSGMYHCLFGPVQKNYDLRISIPGGEVRIMTLSPNGQNICLLMEDGCLYGTSRSFQELIKIYSFSDGIIPTDLLWCGSVCVAGLCNPLQDEMKVSTSQSLFLANCEHPDRYDFIYDLPSAVVAVQDFDGLRLLGEGYYHFLEIIPQEVCRVFSLGSRSPGALLVTTFDEFMAGNASAVDMIREIQRNSDNLIQAINDCVACAAFEFDVIQQKRLLRIAAFGKSFCFIYDADLLINTARRIRVRNTLRTGSSGMLITHRQFCVLGERHLLSRLTQSNDHQIAESICSALGLNSDLVMIDWAMTKLLMGKCQVGQSERSIATTIVGKLKTGKMNSFSELGRLANLKGCRVAAVVFLEAETNAYRQIPTLLSIGETEIALKKGLSSGDGDLLFTVIQHIVGVGGPDIQLISQNEDSKAILVKYASASESNRGLFSSYLSKFPETSILLELQKYLDDVNVLGLALSEGREVSLEMEQERRTATIQSAIMLMTGTHPTGSQSKNEKYFRMQLIVIEQQTALMKELNDPRFVNASPVDMIRLTLEHGKRSAAEIIKRKFNISDKAYQWCMLQTFCSTGQWEAVDEMGGITSRLQPAIGGEAFVNALLSCGRPRQAMQYIQRIANVEDRMEYYVQCGDWAGAGADCKRHGENALFLQVKERSKGNAEFLRQIDDGWKNSQTATALNFSKLFP